ncbi:hypothetical protein ACLQ3D_25750 [Micromonospora vinacea]|uniref:Uncharacterized protein n=1 Tax=Micromonospora vinacea TaxID=709878 RepID=A0ABS0KAR3_9ACTN|nr:hypothetical protein [Micromonospora vinacea]MBG6105660.1 hypothetical protein [Micromonospora vinacea]WSZ78180.1 hypothetical protein OH804_06765 [Micromonospora sp. NBC_00860]WTA65396.1 hypothetical protein OHB51_23110 [Micromonospora sp. NBC_00855]
MTDPRYVPIGLADAGRLIDDDGADTGPAGEIVGADDAKADAARTGADVDLSHAARDGDGAADADADAER